MAFDQTKPATTDNYSTQFTQNIIANFLALALWLDSTNTTITGTVPTFAKRYNRTSKFIEEYSGSAWGTLLQNISGNAATATTVAVINDVATATPVYPVFVAANTGNMGAKVASTKMVFVPSTGILTCTGFAGPLTGNVTGNASGTAANITGIAAVANGGTGSATAGGAPFALKGANNDITSLTGLTTDLSVSHGGTGVSTLTGIVKGNGTAAFTAAAAGDFPTLNQNTTGSSGSCTGNAATVTNGVYTTSNRIAKAWVNFDGTLAGTITPRDSYNISSVTKNGTGDYTLNFSAAMSNANYAMAGSGQLDQTGGVATGDIIVGAHRSAAAYSTTSFRTSIVASDGVVNSPKTVSILIIGD